MKDLTVNGGQGPTGGPCGDAAGSEGPAHVAGTPPSVPEISSELRATFRDGRPLRYSLDTYWRAPGSGDLNYTWRDKPHRLLYDLIAAIVDLSDGGARAIGRNLDHLYVALEARKFHPQASHVRPDYRDGYNAALAMVQDMLATERRIQLRVTDDEPARSGDARNAEGTGTTGRDQMKED